MEGSAAQEQVDGGEGHGDHEGGKHNGKGENARDGCVHGAGERRGVGLSIFAQPSIQGGEEGKRGGSGGLAEGDRRGEDLLGVGEQRDGSAGVRRRSG